VSARKIRRVLVANRSEIACRTIRGIQESGRTACAVFSDPDRSALHVRLADVSWPLGGSTARETYLDAGKLIAAAHAMECDAIHPGYGFLSEKAEFNDACRKAGLVFIGPSPEAQALMGVKTSARAIAQRAGVPVAPGTEPLEAGDAIAAASKIGYPLLVKAAAGGGGKGMRTVRAADELVAAVEGCRRDALSSFGDGRVYLERLIERPRHVEIQVLGDSHGNVVHLYERECSVQRRHQKVIEETPCVALDDAQRRRIGEAACALVREVGYENAGTVEFLLDPSGKFYFLEMNTRLQVEHPVTELTTGIDIVDAQLRIAEGEPLGFGQADVRPRGHAIEGRIYAEDPAKGFLPGAGKILAWEEPSGPGVRVDAGVQGGSEVPVHYDPILAKMVVWAETREKALARFQAALARFTVVGVPTTIPFLRLAAAHPAFKAGDIATDFVERMMGGIDAVAKACAEDLPSREDALAAVAAFLLLGEDADPLPRSRGRAGVGAEIDASSPWLARDAWRVQR
jgi:acetyl/propionyl-CoA carboxylase alpha subunit